MSLHPVRFAPGAVRDLEEALRWYAQRSPMASAGFSAAVLAAVETISNSPRSWPQLTEPGIRKIVVRSYPYTLYFDVIGEVVQVLSIAHHRRMPKDWRP